TVAAQVVCIFASKSMVMVGPEDVARTLILLNFPWAENQRSSASYRMVPRPMGDVWSAGLNLGYATPDTGIR
ncbi:hypothetical protein, partial [Mesorhizobium sp. M7A.F.Ca.CA.001.07.2.1]|uniref:hypothetical protein n=1 Tax=Mesorhizobium sp. M7A.F.Ca.CA.001.07.2.1 TaxID=2496684 RepID=UPI0019D48E4D